MNIKPSWTQKTFKIIPNLQHFEKIADFDHIRPVTGLGHPGSSEWWYGCVAASRRRTNSNRHFHFECFGTKTRHTQASWIKLASKMDFTYPIYICSTLHASLITSGTTSLFNPLESVRSSQFLGLIFVVLPTEVLHLSLRLRVERIKKRKFRFRDILEN